VVLEKGTPGCEMPLCSSVIIMPKKNPKHKRPPAVKAAPITKRNIGGLMHYHRHKRRHEEADTYMTLYNTKVLKQDA
jgi:hypothetical protein